MLKCTGVGKSTEIYYSTKYTFSHLNKFFTAFKVDHKPAPKVQYKPNSTKKKRKSAFISK